MGIRFSKTIYKTFEINAEVGIQNSRYQYKDSAFDFSVMTLTQRQLDLVLPIAVAYKYKINKFSPYASLGMSGSYMLSATATPQREYINNSHKDVTGSDIDLLDNRNRFNATAFLGLGLQYKIPNGYFFFDARYQFGLFNQVDRDNRYNNSELNYIYYYVDNDFKINTYAFSFGYMYLIYKPKPKIQNPWEYL